MAESIADKFATEMSWATNRSISNSAMPVATVAKFVSTALCIVGPLPPPRHGVSSINEAVAKMAEAHNLTPLCFDTSPSGLGNSLRIRATRWLRILRAARGIYRCTTRYSSVVIYFSVSGGWGMLYEIFLIAIARWNGGKMLLHHHSFRYLDHAFFPLRWLNRVAGADAWHVVLCEGMGASLKARCPKTQNVLVLSNAAFFERCPADTRPTAGCKVIGYLSNLSAAKGVFEVLGLARLAQRNGLDFCFKIAGPFEGEEVKAACVALSADLKNVEFLGPLYGEEKSAFFQNADVFVFPTSYPNEAEPLVIHEALSASCPVITFDRGCISALVDERCGLLISRNAPFAPPALELITRWKAEPVLYYNARLAARERFDILHHRAEQARNHLIALLQSSSPSA